MTKIEQIKSLLRSEADISPENQKRFFKTGIGDYGAHDKFIGVSVPVIRKIAKQYNNLTLAEISELIGSGYNEERLLALIVLVNRYNNQDQQDKIYDFYLENLIYVNNWNLVDASCHLIIGKHLLGREKSLLLNLAKSESLWERRIAIVSTWWFIKNNSLEWTIKISEILLGDKHDLIHKASGWMLRELGKKDEYLLINFLQANKKIMPRTMLRYAIEKFGSDMREEFLL